MIARLTAYLLACLVLAAPACAQGVPGLTPGFFAPPTTLNGTFNPSDKSANVNLSNGNLTASVSANSGSVRSTTSEAAGVYYFEVTANASNNMAVGIGTSAMGLSNYPGVDAYGISYVAGTGSVLSNNATVATGATFTTNDVIGVKVDFAAGVTFYKNNVAQAGPITLPSGALFIAVGLGSGSGILGSATLNVTNVYALPSGASIWGY